MQGLIYSPPSSMAAVRIAQHAARGLLAASASTSGRDCLRASPEWDAFLELSIP